MSSRCRERGRRGARGPLALAVPLLVLLAACERRPPERSLPPGDPGRPEVQTSDLTAGPARATPRAAAGPFEGDVHALKEGKRLYGWMNCAGCHGAIGGGAIGPPLADDDWIYGSAPENVHQSIVQGRPEGMPAYGGRIPEEALWKLVAYVRSLGGLPREAEGAQPESSPVTRPREGERRAE